MIFVTAYTCVTCYHLICASVSLSVKGRDSNRRHLSVNNKGTECSQGRPKLLTLQTSTNLVRARTSQSQSCHGARGIGREGRARAREPRHREVYFKELAHAMWGLASLTSVGQAGSWKLTQELMPPSGDRVASPGNKNVHSSALD